MEFGDVDFSGGKKTEEPSEKPSEQGENQTHIWRYLQNAIEELNSGLPRTNPDSGRMEDLNQGPPDFKSSTLNHSAMLPPTIVLVYYVIPSRIETYGVDRTWASRENTNLS